jgi:hypothetical protein
VLIGITILVKAAGQSSATNGGSGTNVAISELEPALAILASGQLWVTPGSDLENLIFVWPA